MDSTTLAYVAKDMGYGILALHMNYGQRTKTREQKCAKKIADHLDVMDFVEISLGYFATFGASSLTDMTIPVEKGITDPTVHPNTYVPFRNANLIAIATAYCEAHDGDAVFIGVQTGDHIGYPDCTPAFIDAMQRVISIGTQTKKDIRLLTPFVSMTKTDILREGLRLGVPYEDTWSCYDMEDIACGACNSCLSRIKAFSDIGVEDPIPYQRR
jgi:7-cyano-7-deazaguanine synthase